MNALIADGSAEMVFHPARFAILQAIASGPLYIDQIATKTGIHPRMVSHHITKLESKKLVLTLFEMTPVGRRNVAVKLCSVSPKYRRVIKAVASLEKVSA